MSRGHHRHRNYDSSGPKYFKPHGNKRLGLSCNHGSRTYESYHNPVYTQNGVVIYCGCGVCERRNGNCNEDCNKNTWPPPDWTTLTRM